MIGKTNGGSGGTGATLTVTAPAGCTVTASKDGKTKTKTAGADGLAVFKGLETGTWTVTITDGEQTAQKTVTVTTDYDTSITFFTATINVTYPAGSTCTATDGVRTLESNDSGTFAFTVDNVGPWTVTSTYDTATIEVSNDETVHLDLSKLYLIKKGYPTNHLQDNPPMSTTNGVAYFTGSAASKNKIDLSKISAFKANVTAYAPGGWGNALQVSNTKVDTSGGIASKKISSNGINTLDLSSQTATLYANIMISSGGGWLKATDIWLE